MSQSIWRDCLFKVIFRAGGLVMNLHYERNCHNESSFLIIYYGVSKILLHPIQCNIAQWNLGKATNITTFSNLVAQSEFPIAKSFF